MENSRIPAAPETAALARRAGASLLLLAAVLGVNRAFAPREAPLALRERLWVSGMVERPGLYSLRPGTPIREALAAAGPRVLLREAPPEGAVDGLRSVYLDREGDAHFH